MNSRPRKTRRTRSRQRLAVRFGLSEPLRNGGYTTNLSSTGIAVAAPVVASPGTQLTLSLQLPGGGSSELLGTVVWSLKGSTSIGLNGAMGIRLDRTDAAYESLLVRIGLAEEVTPARDALPPGSRRPRLPRFSGSYPVEFGSEGELELDGVSLDFSSTGLSVASQFVLPVGSDVAVQVGLPSGETAQATGRVIWCGPRPAMVRGRPNAMGVRLTTADASYLRFVRGLAGLSSGSLTGLSPAGANGARSASSRRGSSGEG